MKEYEVFANICHGGSAAVYAGRRRCDGVPVMMNEHLLYLMHLYQYVR